MVKKVFIDGEVGTTGIQVRDRLSKRDDLEIISPPSDLRKDEATRKKFINEADAVILCEFALFMVYCCILFSLSFVFYHCKVKGFY
jgi:N-acetyl-gamma-glutamylphosphate reductase